MLRPSSMRSIRISARRGNRSKRVWYERPGAFRPPCEPPALPRFEVDVPPEPPELGPAEDDVVPWGGCEATFAPPTVEPATAEADDVTVPTASFAVLTESLAVDVTVPTGSSTADVAVATTSVPSPSPSACAGTSPAKRATKPTKTTRRQRRIRRYPSPSRTSPVPHVLLTHKGHASKRAN